MVIAGSFVGCLNDIREALSADLPERVEAGFLLQRLVYSLYARAVLQEAESMASGEVSPHRIHGDVVDLEPLFAFWFPFPCDVVLPRWLSSAAPDGTTLEADRVVLVRVVCTQRIWRLTPPCSCWTRASASGISVSRSVGLPSPLHATLPASLSPLPELPSPSAAVADTPEPSIPLAPVAGSGNGHLHLPAG